jgi:hypothetical protein
MPIVFVNQEAYMTCIRGIATLGFALIVLLALAPASRAQTPYASPSPDSSSRSADDAIKNDQAVNDETNNDETALEPLVIEGQVVAASENGELLLRTDNGMLAFVVPPEEIQGVSIGQTVQVPLSEDDTE